MTPDAMNYYEMEEMMYTDREVRQAMSAAKGLPGRGSGDGLFEEMAWRMCDGDLVRSGAWGETWRGAGEPGLAG